MKFSEMPYKGTIVCCIFSSIVWSLFATLLPPNIPFMLRSYKEHLDDVQVSAYNSWMASLFFLGQIIGNVFWGWLADRIGRKISIIITLSLNVVCIIAFGLCDRVYPALVIRFIHGVIDGSVPITKTIQTEVATPETIGFISSLFFVGISIGGLIGPTLGGYLSKVENIKGVIRVFPIFKDHPYLFPFVIDCLFYLVTIILFWVCCVETLPKEKRVNKSSQLHLSSSSFLLMTDEEAISTEEAKSIPWYKLFSSKDAILLLTLNTLASLVTFGFLTIFSVAVTNKIEYDGLELEREESSVITSITNVFQVAIILFMPLLGKLFLYKDILGIAVLILGVCTLLYPVLPYVLEYGKIVLFAIILPYNVLVSFSNSLILNTTMILFSNIAYDEYRGIVMGMSETIACITRCISPVLFSYLYSWTLTRKPTFWVNPHLTFIILGIIGIISSFIALGISAETNKGKGSLKASVKDVDKPLLA